MTAERQTASPEIRTDRLDAVIFDLDGVITDTASVHRTAWKRMFDQWLAERPAADGENHEPFSDEDYYVYVDGRPRYDGVDSFLDSRGISVPRGEPSDSPMAETTCGLGNRKDQLFVALLRERGAVAFASSVEFLERLRTNRTGTAIISASRNCAAVLDAAGIAQLFDAKVDGVDADELGLAGKPDPAVFLEAARRLGVQPVRAAVVEDALAGVEAGRRGRFGLVIGIDRAGHGEELRERGADVVVDDLGAVRISTGGDGS
jgi:alpha,alpha-trehalase